jgi:hypothetical protein
MSAVVPIRPPTDLERVDAAIGKRVASIADMEAKARQVEASLAISRTALVHLRASRTFLENANLTPKQPSQWLAGRILQHRMEPPVETTDGDGELPTDQVIGLKAAITRIRQIAQDGIEAFEAAGEYGSPHELEGILEIAMEVLERKPA